MTRENFWYDETFEGKTRYGCMVRKVLFSGESKFRTPDLAENVEGEFSVQGAGPGSGAAS